MAIDKAVDSAVLDAGLTAIANAIREKTGGTDALAWPDGLVEAIAGIGAGIGDVVMSTGTLVSAETTNNPTFEITHGLGMIPTAMVMWQEQKTNWTSGILVMCVNCSKNSGIANTCLYIKSSGSISSLTCNSIANKYLEDEVYYHGFYNANENTAMFKTDMRSTLYGGTVYRWFAYGGDVT